MQANVTEESLVIVDKISGEIVGEMPVGFKVITPKQMEARRQYSSRKNNYEMRKCNNSELGYFYFIYHEHQLGNISAETVGRLIYLLTYVDYNNNFMIRKNCHMKKSNLQEVLHVSRATANRFWNEIKDVYIKESDKGLMLICDDIIRGKINDKQKLFQKFYIRYIRDLYSATKSTNHRYLGYIYQIMPYINFEYNVLCKNPLETNIEDVELLTLMELCDCIGYDKNNSHKLVKIYDSITLDVDGHKEYLLSFVKNKGVTKMFINPHIIYAGSNYEQVKILGLFVKQ